VSAHYRIRLEDNRGKVVLTLEDAAGVVDDVLVPLSKKRNGQLQFVDRYGTTVFNGAQAEALLSEIEEARALSQSASQGQLLSSLKDLARRCSDEPHLFLKFYGD
jgi:hypothetical protein